MLLTMENLHMADYENQDAKLIIEDLIVNHQVKIVLYEGAEITIELALSMWHSISKSEKMKYISVSDYKRRLAAKRSRTRHYSS